VFLRCHQLQAAGLLSNHLEDLVTLIAGTGIGVYEVRADGVRYSPPRYEPD
jgi:hypothetical protein